MSVVALAQSFVDAVLTLETPVVGYTTYRAIEEALPDYLGPVRRPQPWAVIWPRLQGLTVG